MKPVTQLPQNDVVTENIYLQREIDLSRKIITAIENSPDINRLIEAWKKATDHKQRIIGELEKFREKKNEIETMIEAIKSDFGSENSFDDLKKVGDYELQLKAISDAIPLLENKLEYRSNLSREIIDNGNAIAHAISLELKEINRQLQEEIDGKAQELLQTFLMYKISLDRVLAEQKAIPQELLKWTTLKEVLPEVNGLEDLIPNNFRQLIYAAGVKSGKNIPGVSATENNQAPRVVDLQPNNAPPPQVDLPDLARNIFKR